MKIKYWYNDIYSVGHCVSECHMLGASPDFGRRTLSEETLAHWGLLRQKKFISIYSTRR